jgi:hypothetical protein
MPSVNWTWFLIGLAVGYFILGNVIAAVSSRVR